MTADITADGLATPNALANARRAAQIRILNDAAFIQAGAKWGRSAGAFFGALLGGTFNDMAHETGEGIGSFFGAIGYGATSAWHGKHPVAGGEVVEGKFTLRNQGKNGDTHEDEGEGEELFPDEE